MQAIPIHIRLFRILPAPLAGYTLDTAIHTVSVAVTDNPATGKLDTNVVYSVNPLVFSNTYFALGRANITGSVNFLGREIGAAETLSVKLTPSTMGDLNTTQTVNTTRDPVNKKNSSFSFANLTYTKPGIYTYEVTHVSGSDPAVTYDCSVYRVTATVTDANSGNLNVSLSYQTGGVTKSGIGFVDKIDKNGSITLPGSVTFGGRSISSGLFGVKITDLDKGNTYLSTVADGGNVSFTPSNASCLNYTIDDIGTHNYLITQVIGSDSHTVYDSGSYVITVQVEDNNGTELNTSVSRVTKDGYTQTIMPSNYFTFTNVYKDYDEITGKGTYTFYRNRMYKSSISFEISDDGCSYATNNTFYAANDGTYTLR